MTNAETVEIIRNSINSVNIKMLGMMAAMLSSMIYIVKNSNKTLVSLIAEQSKRVDKLTTLVGSTMLGGKQTVEVFKSFMHEHIDRKLCETERILLENNIKVRQAQIKKNLRSIYEGVTQDVCAKLSMFNTPIGDLGNFLTSVLDFDKFMNEVYEIFFTYNSRDDVKIILSDLRSLMHRYLNQILREMEVRIRQNTI